MKKKSPTVMFDRDFKPITFNRAGHKAHPEGQHIRLSPIRKDAFGNYVRNGERYVPAYAETRAKMEAKRAARAEALRRQSEASTPELRAQEGTASVTPEAGKLPQQALFIPSYSGPDVQDGRGSRVHVRLPDAGKKDGQGIRGFFGKLFNRNRKGGGRAV